MNTQIKIPTVLKRLIEQRQCVAFVGAGFSAAIGMPSWGGLLLQLSTEAEEAAFDNSTDESIAKAKEAIYRNEFTLAASILRPLFSGANLNRAIARQFDMQVFHKASMVMQARMLKRLENLISIPWAGIISTNFDTLVEHGISLYSLGNYTQADPYSDNFGDVLSSNAVDERFFVKLHGSVAGAGYVLGTEEYDRIYLSSTKAQIFLSATMLRYSLFFIGSSLEDEILRIRRKLCNDFRGKIPTAYALLPRNSINEGRSQWLRDQAQIISILYDIDSTSNKDHIEVDNFLSNLNIYTDSVYLRDETVSSLSKMSISNRVSQIGTLNRDLIYLISKEGNSGLSHASLLAPNANKMSNIDKSIFRMSPEERVYRVMFLISINLVSSNTTKYGEKYYTAEPDILSFLHSS